jgi:hypothetical protein
MTLSTHSVSISPTGAKRVLPPDQSVRSHESGAMHALPVPTPSLALHVSVIDSDTRAASRLALHKPTCISFLINTHDRCRCSGEGVAFPRSLFLVEQNYWHFRHRYNTTAV